MNDWIIDTSVIIKWVLTEPDSTLALKVITDTASAAGILLVLDLALVEATNVIWTRLHRRLLILAEARQAMTLLQQATVQILPSVPLLTAAFESAAQFDVAVYDALFVATARAQNCHGVSADEPLVRAVGGAYPEIKLLRDW